MDPFGLKGTRRTFRKFILSEARSRLNVRRGGNCGAFVISVTIAARKAAGLNYSRKGLLKRNARPKPGDVIWFAPDANVLGILPGAPGHVAVIEKFVGDPSGLGTYYIIDQPGDGGGTRQVKVTAHRDKSSIKIYRYWGG